MTENEVTEQINELNWDVVYHMLATMTFIISYKYVGIRVGQYGALLR
jgi:hypothetical protein